MISGPRTVRRLSKPALAPGCPVPGVRIPIAVTESKRVVARGAEENVYPERNA